MMRTSKGGTSYNIGSSALALTVMVLVVTQYFLWQKMFIVTTAVNELTYQYEKSNKLDGSIVSSFANPQQGAQGAAPVVAVRPTMHDIGSKTLTDKVSMHGYDRFYPFFLEQFRDMKGFQMLEIGYNLGYSYQMWLEYFPLGKVYFMEKDVARSHPEARFTGDQGKVSDLQNMLLSKGIEGSLDFIIDDGSHHPVHQMVAFEYLFLKGLKPGGVYIIEDTETSYWRSGNTYGLSTEYGRNSPDSAINRLKGLVDVVNHRYEYAEEPFHSSFSQEVDANVLSITFVPNAVIILKKKPSDFAQRYDSSSYPWKDKLLKPAPK
jgi:hypothetical protein